MVVILLITFFLGMQIPKIQLSYKRQNILPSNHVLIEEFNEFKKIFPGDDNLIMIGVKDSALFTNPENLKAWDRLANELDSLPETSKVITITRYPSLKIDRKEKRSFYVEEEALRDFSLERVKKLQTKFSDSLPFYHNILYSESGAVNMLIYVNPRVIDTKRRKEFVLKKLLPAVESFENNTKIKPHISGLIYIRTLNGELIKNELPLFIILTLVITSFILWFFFRSFPPILISLTIVILASVWVTGFMGLLGFKITILTAIIPALIIVIGVPNTIFLINKYQQEIIKHGNQARSLQRVITKTGTAIFMTNLTTALGFFTFTVVNNNMLREFGIAAAFGILSLFIISIILIPAIYSYLHIPRSKHLRHLEKKWLSGFIDWLIFMVKRKKVLIFSVALTAIVFSLIGINRIKISGSILADLPRNQKFYQDIKFFEKEFGGILPLDFLIDTGKKKGALKKSTLKKINQFQEEISILQGLSHPVSVVNLIKYSKQVFYKGNPKFYSLPSGQERNFIMPYYKNTDATDLGQSYVDSLGRFVRITTFMKDMETDEMKKIEHFLNLEEKKIFPEDQYKVTMTGQARLFLEGTEYLLNNLVWSLGLAIVLISLVVYMLLGSFRTLTVAMLSNLLPLLLTAGLMGFLHIPLKPSTILIFSITLGISIDDTIHFLTKYREELRKHHGRVKKAVYLALKETGISMFYTSIVLFFGFLVFLISNYGGTKALGGLVSFTLFIAMFSNLLLLPSLILFLDHISVRRNKLEKS